MKKLLIFSIISICNFAALAQKVDEKKPDEKAKPVVTIAAKESLGTVVVNADAIALDLAKGAVKAHGGDKFKGMLTLAVKGSADISVEGQSFSLVSSFYTALAGEKYRIELNNALFPFKQTYNGEQTSSSGGRGVNLPPLNKIGLPLLQNIDQKDFVITALDEKKKKKSGFRITSPDGFSTDFFVDEKTGQIKGYEATFIVNDISSSTSVEIDKLREVEGVLIPEKYSQRFEFGGGLVVYSAFKAKEIFVNTKLDDEIFAMPKP